MTYSGTGISGGQYTIDFDATANAAGFADVAYTAMPTSPLNIAIPASAAAGTYNGTITVKNANNCESVGTSFSVTVNATPTATLTSSDADNTICAGEAITFTAGEVAGATYQFFVNGSSVFGPSASRSYTTTTLPDGQGVSVRVAIGTCQVTSLVIITAITPRPTAADAGNDQRINGTSTTLAGNAASVGTGAWSIVSNNTPGGTLADASNPQSGFSGLPGTTYTLRWTISNGICAPSTDDVSVAFNQIGTATTAANATATYGDASVDLVASVTPAGAPGSVQFFVNGTAVGTANLSSGTATFSYNLGGVSANTYTIRAEYAGSGPYTASNSGNGTLTVAPKALTASVTANGKTYDGTADATLASRSVSGKVGDDDVILTGGTAAFADKNVGANKTVTAAGFSLTGAAAGNYRLAANSAATTASITAKDLTIGITATGKVYDGNANATVSAAIADGLVSGDQVTVAAANGQFNDKNAAAGKTVTASVSITGGDDAGNYTANASAATQADITAKPVTAALDATDKVYDGTDEASAAGSVPVLGSDAVTVTVTDARFNNKTVGSNKPVTATVALSGAAAGNYRLSAGTASTTASITAKALAVNVTAQNKVYDGNANANVAAAVTSGLVAGDDVTVSAANGRFADKNVGDNKAVTASIGKSGDDAGNYAVNATAQTTADITVAQLVIAIAAPDKVYDGKRDAQVSASIGSGLVRGDDVTVAATNGLFADKNVGTNKAVTASVSKSGDDAGNYTANASAETTAAITALGIDGSFTAAGKTYDGNDAAAVTGRSPNGVLAGDQVTLAGGTARFDNKNVGTDKTVTLNGAALAGTDAANYRLGEVATAKADITAKGLTPAIAAGNKTYDGTTTATLSSQSVSGTVDGETVILVVGAARFDSKNVGAGKTVTATGLSLGGDDAGNYSLTANTATTTASITAKSLTASLSARDKVYDGNTTATATGSVPAADVVDGDEVPVTVTNARFNDKQVGTGKPVTADVSIGNGNYSLTAATAATTASITPKGLTIGITAADKVYDGTTAATVTAAITAGLVAGDDVTVAAANGAFNNKNAGNNKPVNADVSTGGADAGNYTANANASASADITARTLVVSATGVDKVYDGNATATVTLADNRVAGDALTIGYASAAFNNKNAGTGKPVSVSGISVTGADAGNYTADVIATTTADITKRNLVVTATGVNKVYDGTTTATVNLSDDRLAGDALTLSYASASFDNRNAGTNKAVTVTGIAISGADAGNYAANATAATTADITPKAIAGAFTAGDKVYDGTVAATVATRTLSGIISPDAVTLTGGAAAFADKHVGTGKTVTLTGASLTGANAGNYSLTSVNTTTAGITRRTLVVSATGINKVYDGTTAATVTLSDNRVAGDALTLSYASASFNTINVGTGKPVSVTGINVTGADAGNYSFNATAGTTANITAAPVVLTASVAPASQQYSDRVTFTARIAGGAPLGTGTAGAAQTVTFSVGTQVMGTANLMVDGKDLVATLANVALLELPTANGQMAPGAKTVRAVFGSPNADYGLSGANSEATGALTITREDAEAEYTGAQSVATTSTTSSTAVVTLSATLRDISAVTGNPDANPGDIRNARIRFVRIDNGVVTPVTNTSATNGAITDAAGWTTVGLVNAADLKTGTMLVKTTANIGSADATQFTYRIEVAGYYQSNEENFVVNVYKPLNDFITGGGHIIPTASAGTYASDAGRKTNFGFNVRYNKTGKNLQGNINTIFRRKESDGIVHVYQIKGNAMTSLSVNAAVATAKTAIFNGKANMADITNPLMPVSLGGNLTLQVTMTDRGEPGTNDQIGITVYNNAGGIFYSSSWSGTRTAEMNLRGGNLVVNSGSMTFGTTTATGRESAAAAQSAETTTAFTVNAYPNPFADKFHLSIGSEVTGDVALTVVDGKGRTVTRQVARAAGQGAARTVEIDLSGEPHGMYLLHVQSGAKREVIKVFKTNR